jgi:hypothetical protein
MCVMEPPTRQSIALIRDKFEVDGTVQKQRPGTIAGLTSQSQRYVTTDGQSASLSWCQVPSWTQDQIFVTVRPLLVCWCGAPCLKRGRVCRLQFCWSSPAQSYSGPSTVGSWPYFTVLDSKIPPPAGTRHRIYIPQEQGGPLISPGTGFSFHRLLRLAGLRWRCSNPPTHRFQQLLHCCVRKLRPHVA